MHGARLLMTKLQWRKPKTPQTPTTQPPYAYQRSILAIAPKLTKGGSFMEGAGP